ncbi:MAG TPA: hypothetical protein VGB51_09865 [Actinomycetota bacterium]
MNDPGQTFARRGHQGPETQGKLRLGLSLGQSEDLWSWFEGSTADLRDTEDWTRFEGVEGFSDAMLRTRSDTR